MRGHITQVDRREERGPMENDTDLSGTQALVTGARKNLLSKKNNPFKYVGRYLVISLEIYWHPL